MAMTEEERKEAKKGYNKKYRETHHAEILEHAKIYREINHAEVLERSRTYREENHDILLEKQRRRSVERHDKKLESSRRWAENNKDKSKESRKKYRSANHKKVLDGGNKWRNANIEKVRGYNRKRQHAHLNIYRVYNEKRRAYKLSAPGNGVTVEQWEQIKEEYNYMCVYCCRKEPEIDLAMDHIEPLSKGGAHDVENIAPACASCNSSKNAKTLLRYLYDTREKGRVYGR